MDTPSLYINHNVTDNPSRNCRSRRSRATRALADPSSPAAYYHRMEKVTQRRRRQRPLLWSPRRRFWDQLLLCDSLDNAACEWGRDKDAFDATFDTITVSYNLQYLQSDGVTTDEERHSDILCCRNVNKTFPSQLYMSLRTRKLQNVEVGEDFF